MSTIAEKLTYLAGTKSEIASAIVEKGQSVGSSDTFRSYADKIRAINTEYKSGSKSISENGTYNASDDGLDGYSSVTVNVSEGSGSGSGSGSGEGGETTNITVESLNVTENGTYTADEGKAYSPVTVNVPEFDLKGTELTVTASGNLSAGDSVYIEGTASGMQKRDDITLAKDRPFMAGSGGRYVFTTIGNRDYGDYVRVAYCDTNVYPWTFRNLILNVTVNGTTYENIQMWAYGYATSYITREQDNMVCYAAVNGNSTLVVINMNTLQVLNTSRYYNNSGRLSSYPNRPVVGNKAYMFLGGSYSNPHTWVMENDLSTGAERCITDVARSYSGSIVAMPNASTIVTFNGGYYDSAYINIYDISINRISSYYLAPNYNTYCVRCRSDGHENLLIYVSDSNGKCREKYGSKWTGWFHVKISELASASHLIDSSGNDTNLIGEQFIIPAPIEGIMLDQGYMNTFYTDPTGTFSIIVGCKLVKDGSVIQYPTSDENGTKTDITFYLYNWATNEATPLTSNNPDSSKYNMQHLICNKWIIANGEVWEMQNGGTVARAANNRIHGTSKLGYVKQAIQDGQSGTAVVLFS